jgi:hypothetical protein
MHHRQARALAAFALLSAASTWCTGCTPAPSPSGPVATATDAGAVVERCPHGCIANTDVDATPVNLAVVMVCERYRIAYEQGDTAAIVALAAPAYHDDADGGRPALDRASLPAELARRFASQSAARFDARYHSVVRDPSGARATVTFSALISVMADGGAWRHAANSDRRLVLVLADGRWLVAGGM